MYTAYFGFREKPFSVTPDPRFFYSNAVYREAYASLLYGIQERKGFIVLTGEVGTGKTTLLRRLMDNLEATVRFVFFYNTTLTFEELLSFTCEELGLSVSRETRLRKIRALNEFLIDHLKKGGTAVLLIDEAQHLSEDVTENLRLLSNLETGTEKLLQIVLVGQPELERRLAEPSLRQFKQRVAIQCRLDALKAWEVGPYIDYRLKVAGYDSHGLFTSDAVERITHHSNGIPRLINVLCDNALLIAYATSRKKVAADMIEQVASDLRLESARDEPGIASIQAPKSAHLRTHYRAHRSVRRGLPPRRQRGAEQDTDDEHSFWRPRSVLLNPKPNRLRPAVLITLFVLLLGLGSTAVYTWHTKRVGSIQYALSGWTGFRPTLQDFLGTVAARLSLLTSRFTSADAESENVQTPTPPSQVSSVPEYQTPSNPGAEPSVLADARTPSRPATNDFLPLPEVKASGQLIALKHGDTISEIAFTVYGHYSALAMDLIMESNPHLDDLDKVVAGERLRLPAFTRDTLLRKQPDGSFRLVLASFPSRLQAMNLEQVVRDRGYQVTTTPKRVSDDLSFHRIEIIGLHSPEEANRAWTIALENNWFSLPKSAVGRENHG